MSIKAAKSFIERVKTDEEFAKKVVACKDAQEREAFAKAAGFDFTPDQFTTILSELTDDDLKTIVGGSMDQDLPNIFIF